MKQYQKNGKMTMRLRRRGRQSPRLQLLPAAK
jgi:hypothetical protein